MHSRFQSKETEKNFGDTGTVPEKREEDPKYKSDDCRRVVGSPWVAEFLCAGSIERQLVILTAGTF